MTEPEHERQFDYPVSLGNSHRAVETLDYPRLGDRFECPEGSYTHTGAWPTFSYCPYCGGEINL